MSSPDFLDRLRGAEGPDAPPVDVVRARARRIVRRRYVVASSGAVVVALIAGIGLFVRGPSAPTRSGSTSSLTEAASAPTAAPAVSAGSSSALAQKAAPAVASPVPQNESAGASTTAGGYAAADRALTPAFTMTATLSVKKRSVGRGDDFTLKVCNNTSATQTRSFGTAQRYDFEVKRGDAHVWQWSHGKSFAQQTGTLQWKPSECKSWTETWDAMDDSGAPVTPGSYSVVAWLVSQPERSKPVTFCLDVC